MDVDSFVEGVIENQGRVGDIRSFFRDIWVEEDVPTTTRSRTSHPEDPVLRVSSVKKKVIRLLWMC